MTWRAEVVDWADIVAVLTSASGEGWTVVSMSLHATGATPALYVIWSRDG